MIHENTEIFDDKNKYKTYVSNYIVMLIVSSNIVDVTTKA